MNDPIADMLTRIRNANMALLPEVAMSHSNMRESIAKILKREGYVSEVAVEGKPGAKNIKVKLKYQGRKGVIAGLRRVSTPGLRRYVGATEIPRVLGGMGISILSTPRGVLSGTEARKQNVGGEVLAYIW
jgi:small subunit ribosomal protein S8